MINKRVERIVGELEDSEAVDKCSDCGKVIKSGGHTINGQRVCCTCNVTRHGGTPSDWHSECLQAYSEMLTPPTGGRGAETVDDTPLTPKELQRYQDYKASIISTLRRNVYDEIINGNGSFDLNYSNRDRTANAVLKRITQTLKDL